MKQRVADGSNGAPEEIRIRHVQNREFGFGSNSQRSLNYESIFRLTPDDGKCLLTWEIRYQVCRLPDIIRREAIAAAARENMATSLDYIRRLAISYPIAVYARDRIYEARRDQVPAA